MKQAEWLLCPICHNKTRIRVREDTELKNFLLYCPKCRNEVLINLKKKHISIKEPDAQTQSR
ncbi:MAG: cysteine-rich KTR domain-containing protein [Oscillospiraceae bacterium]